MSQGGTGPTSSLTQFARSTAAYILGYQRYHQVSFYAISIQNELNFEVFYNSATYPLSSQYITAVKAVRAEFDKHPELKDIKIMGPEDLLGGDSYGMWEYGGPIHKNLQYLRNIALDTAALKAIDFFCIHGYADDGVTSSGANPREWDWWVNGWNASPAPGIPANVKGFTSYGKKSWMTETSGEFADWLFPKSGFPGEGGLGVGLRIQQALTSGLESAWIYWTFSENDNQGNVSRYGLTNQALGINSPKYVAAKHFFKLIRPDAIRVGANVSSAAGLTASAYIHSKNRSLTIVLINATANVMNTNIHIPDGLPSLAAFTSRENSYWQSSNVSVTNRMATIQLPAYGMVTLQGNFMPTSTDQKLFSSEIQLHTTPNPFSESTKIVFSLKESGQTRLDLYDDQGIFIKTILNDHLKPAEYQTTLHRADLKSGVYFLELKTSKIKQTYKLLVLDK